MRIISFSTEESIWSRPRLGILLDEPYRLDCERLFADADRPTNPLSWFDLDGKWFQKARQIYEKLAGNSDAIEQAASSDWLVRSKDAYWFAPVPRPGKLICIGLNYRDHAAESNLPIPKEPVVFSKFSSAVIAPGEPVIIPPSSTQVDYEAELAVVIGRRARNISASRALDYVFGYTCLNDVSARDFQFADGQCQREKSSHTVAPMGPTIVTVDKLRDPHKLPIKLIRSDDCR